MKYWLLQFLMLLPFGLFAQQPETDKLTAVVKSGTYCLVGEGVATATLSGIALLIPEQRVVNGPFHAVNGVYGLCNALIGGYALYDLNAASSLTFDQQLKRFRTAYQVGVLVDVVTGLTGAGLWIYGAQQKNDQAISNVQVGQALLGQSALLLLLDTVQLNRLSKPNSAKLHLGLNGMGLYGRLTF